MNNVPNINKFGAAKRPNKKFGGPRGSERGGSISAKSMEIICVYGFLCFLYHFKITVCTKITDRAFIVSAMNQVISYRL